MEERAKAEVRGCVVVASWGAHCFLLLLEENLTAARPHTYTTCKKKQARVASLEGRVLSLTHELEAAREEAAAAEGARAASAREYERALAGRVRSVLLLWLCITLVLHPPVSPKHTHPF